MVYRILVTGSSGLIGSVLTRALLARGIHVVCFDLRAKGDEQGDIIHATQVRNAVAHVHGIVHLAAVSRVIWAEQNPDLCAATNITGVNNVLAGIRRAKPRPWLIFASSREVYGQATTMPVDEDCPLRPINVYGRSKVAGEELIEQAKLDDVRACTVRFSSVYGLAADHPNRVVPAFARAAARGQILNIEGPGHTFDFTHVGDVVRGLLTVIDWMMERRPLPPPIHFVSGQPTTLAELASLALSLAKPGAKSLTVPPRGGDVTHFVGDPARAQALLGWRARIPLAAGMAQLIADYRVRPKPIVEKPEECYWWDARNCS